MSGYVREEWERKEGCAHVGKKSRERERGEVLRNDTYRGEGVR
jgi:hypothetical protein